MKNEIYTEEVENLKQKNKKKIKEIRNQEDNLLFEMADLTSFYKQKYIKQR